MEILLIIAFIILLFSWAKASQLKKEKSDLNKKVKSLVKEFETFKKETKYLKKYTPIKDIESELEKTKNEIEQILINASYEADSIRNEAKDSTKEMRAKAKLILEEAHNLSLKIENTAKQKAKDIAGEAWEAKQNADQYSETVKAMKNIITGYGDEYLIQNHSLLDELAQEYDHKKAGKELTQIRKRVKSMIKNGESADCDYAEHKRRTTAIEFVLDAFNGKVDTIMAKVKHDNFGKLQQQLNDAFRLVNHNGKPFRNARITERYFDVILEQLTLAVTVHELKKQDQEEQREIREAMREEERARREYEKALRETEKEEKLLAKAMKEAESKLAHAALEERDKFKDELEKIKLQLAEAEQRSQRVLSMAQQTKRGHIYIISNVGSFGENIVKIGMTRRLEPMDRVKELGDASVPFIFDVHAMIHSENAPKLEKELHKAFEENRVNRINYRKEFFSIPVAEIKSKFDELGLETHWTMKAEALEYRESIELKKRSLELTSSN